ncbi:SDR family NAD(P)-dependent oxidoreductase [Caldovatus aquaticus]|uniref:SDR family oxidoreductase n=1 Tax=Caldovatus aquaticus TaxID=2865671 RepID=A0ABS7EXA4_9PROT|nr:SDR family oxidoreductase [Caldovatus aquaticus]MBW8267929.1 SDR family oxidoreductase [Caldovatus aquaticus]
MTPVSPGPDATEGRGRVAVVIGGANGIGAATARLMAARGWRVALADCDAAAGGALAAALAAPFFALDVTDRAAVAALPARVEAALGPAAALVVSAGAFQRNLRVEEEDPAELDRILAVNVKGTWCANRAFGPGMARRRAGSIVNLASTAASLATPLSIYGPSKSAIVGMTRSFAGEWGRAGVRVNAVSPGITLVERVRARLRSEPGRYGADPAQTTALGRLVAPEEVAEAIAFLCSDRASAITGIDLTVDCGWGVSAGWAMYGGVRPPPA